MLFGKILDAPILPEGVQDTGLKVATVSGSKVYALRKPNVSFSEIIVIKGRLKWGEVTLLACRG